jgi:GxxExxY protein
MIRDPIHRRGAETQREFLHKDLTEQIIGAAIEVHKNLGPGLLESAYEECLCRELAMRSIPFERQVSLPVEYKGARLDCGYRIDILVAGLVVIELKYVDRVLPVHDAQLLTYMRLTKCHVGLMFNFYTDVLTRGGVIRKAITAF